MEMPFEWTDSNGRYNNILPTAVIHATPKNLILLLDGGFDFYGRKRNFKQRIQTRRN